VSGRAATRFAPSPTGKLHVGNARVALVNWLFARRTGGSFLLRLDDTDAERSTAEFAAGIERDLAWLGLGWDRFARQSDRLADYAAAAERLKSAGRLYPCYETEDELKLKRGLDRAAGRPPRYDRAALTLTADERRALEAAGRRPHWRFLLRDETVAWDDLVRGAQRIEAHEVSDPVLIRSDGGVLYTLSSVVDDIAFGITHVVRGEDHVTNTAVQIELFEALGAALPVFAHLPHVMDADGAPLSKRLGSVGLESLRAAGFEPEALASALARLGTSRPVEPFLDLAPLVADFDWRHFSRSPPRFDPAELALVNARLLHALPYAAAKPRLTALGLDAADEAFWLAVRGNLGRLAEARDWWNVVHGAVAPPPAEPGFADVARATLPAAPLGPESWAAWTRALGAATGRKGKALFQPLRLALTGRETGPEMKALLPLIGRERALKRLSGEAA
jgi:glutamyl-tRNA synthetase